MSRDELMEAIWAQQPAEVQTALSALLTRLRRAVGSERLQGRADLRLLLPDDTWIDAEAALTATHTAEAAISRQDWAAACVACDISFAIARRELLPGLEAPWLEDRRRQLEESFVRGREHYAVVALALGGVEVSGAERAAREVIARAPYRERAHELLMRALVAQGSRADALVIYDRLRTLLREDLGTEPAAPLQRLHLAILRDDPI